MRRLLVTCGWPVVLSGHSGFLHHLKLIFDSVFLCVINYIHLSTHTHTHKQHTYTLTHIHPWGHHSSMRFSPMWFCICEKVVSNLWLAIGSPRALKLPPPPKTGIPYPHLLSFHSSLPIQTDSQHACQDPTKSE